MAEFIEPIARLVNELSKLPGVGRRSAARLAYHIIEASEEEATELAKAIVNVKRRVKLCPVCFDLSEGDLCPICADAKRDASKICVVGDPRDVSAMERTGEIHGKYHVLHGTISPGEGRGPDDIKLKELLSRLADVKEVIIATNPDLEGEATAMYIARLIKPMGIEVTRIAHGVPVGSDLQYADEVTLGRAIIGRRPL